MGSRLPVFVVAALGVVASPLVAQTPPSLPVVPGALDVVAHAGGAAVEYDVKESYPALKTIGYLVDTLPKLGWNLTEVGASPDPSPDSRPARVSGERPPTHVWEARWRNPAGGEIAFVLTSLCPFEGQGMHSAYVHVSGVQYGPKEAAGRQAQRERHRQEVCAALRERSPGLAPPSCAK